MAELERDKRRLERRLEQAELLLDIQKRLRGCWRSRSGAQTTTGAPTQAVDGWDLPVCAALGVARATLYRHRSRSQAEPAPVQVERSSPRALGAEERQAVLARGASRALRGSDATTG